MIYIIPIYIYVELLFLNTHHICLASLDCENRVFARAYYSICVVQHAENRRNSTASANCQTSAM